MAATGRHCMKHHARQSLTLPQPTHCLTLPLQNTQTMASAAPDDSAAAAAASDASDNDEDVEREQQVIVLLDLASLETVKTKRGNFELLNADDHRGTLKRASRGGEEPRPDIAHQELLALLDSPLNKAGRMKVYVRTARNVLIEINPKCRIPRTFKRFAGLMVQLLHKLKVRASNGSETLLRVVKSPLARHLPAGFKAYGFSKDGTLYRPAAFAARLPDDKPIVFVLGAMSAGSIDVNDHPFIEELVSLSGYPLAGATAINRLCGAVEAQWGIF